MPKIELSSKWSCDRRELKPKSGGSSSDVWILTGREIKPKYSPSSNNTYELNGNPILVAFGQIILKLW